MAFWQDELAGASLSHLPTDYIRPIPLKSVDAQISRNITHIDFDRLLSVLLILVSKFTGDVDVSIGCSDNQNQFYVARHKAIKFDQPLSRLYDDVTKIRSLTQDHAESFSTYQESIDQPLYHVRCLQGKASRGTSPLDIDLTVISDEEELTIAYNSLLFSAQRISILLDQILFLYNADSSKTISEVSTITDSQSHIIPDPTHDLDWTGYRGAIPTIFSSNAAAHPDRPCVVVTGTDEGDITYTYDHIHRQSNALANHLVGAGIERGDVVVIYAFRGADLMVAVMGILKAGATFSVIDPAYPETRQCIYLDVARPRGLIVLRKAGRLSEHVIQWIQDNLDPLKVNIADLELSSDGQSMVGIPHNTSQANTNIDIGPDDIPTLSFTSGSEGIPKGVRGRHFSLAHYFPWMAKHFGLSSEDRFTMLSGIAHDPIQRDMFTPLFLGATLVVPTADDIGTPGKLAEWCDKQKVTVTHLTPAMGQLLSSQVAAGVQIPSLRNAFFVGDVLTKRDVKRLQGLARHVDIINMYGTTETQRAVSYFRIPSVEKDSGFLNTCKDIMPAGTGMQNVQLLVVSRDGSRRICGVGEVGEIFVRAGGLAEGYLSLDEVTAQKFVKSWFVDDNTWSSKSYSGQGLWKGVRDRLYRSGDLGRYMPDGNVECCGRADDQVKIRGFRIELGEIDTHLSRHPLVRENITLLRRNKDEEPTLVSYFVPDKKPELQQFINSEHTELKCLTVLISGSGSNLQALIDSTTSGVLKGKAKITHVISNRKNAYGLERAQHAGIPTTVWSLAASRKRFGDSREQYDAELARLILEPGNPDLVICAGFMHILSVDFLRPMSAAHVGIINLHPALPGQFNGAQAIERAFAAFQADEINETGIMIHWVIAEVDMGEPILIQKIPIESGTSLENLEKRIHEAEHRLIVDATDKIISRTQQDTLVQRMQKYQPLVRDIREYLKGKLASYAVPSVYVPMDKMPLNPNGKVDKPALPYPDTAQQSAATKSNTQNGELTSTQHKMHDIWREVLPQSPATIPIDENFFDLGGHSILATKLIFQIRKAFVMDDLSLGLIFKAPTIAQLSREVDQLRAGDVQTEAVEAEYAKDAERLLKSLNSAYPTRQDINDSEEITVFLTGATGFLGTFIMRELLTRKNVKRVITHVRAKDESSARTRLTETLKGYGIYNSDWSARIDVVAGDLALPRLGLTEESWNRVLEVDCIIHNGALVHWVYPYSQLRAANVLSTLSCLELCSLGRPKTMTFVSSTSVLDTQHYVVESDRLIASGHHGILESDSLSGSKEGLGTGYGQSKWVSELLCREAGLRGLRGSIVRPGYVVSDSQRGIMNTDDFLVRLMKGCIQIGKYPAMTNSINMVPVDHVARCVVASSMNGLSEFSVGHVTSHPRLRFIDFLSSLEVYGYRVNAVDYIPWKTRLEEYVQSNEEQNALFPLLHFVTSDLPASTKAPELDDSNMRTILRRDERFSGVNHESGMGVNVDTMGIAIAFLIKVGYLPAPTMKGREVPEIEYTGTYTGGRASAAK